jgi:alkanesulfonate monooxygenase SsuD/methylene tetrahydromethanopterin reductase-like flavin-dependent oxidoreductase (luciferase family)
VKFAVHVPNFGPFADPRAIAQLAAATEQAGWDGFFVWDHNARPEGEFAMCDPWIALTVAASATQRVCLGPLITPLARRRPWNVAREVSSLDHLSDGRMVLGVGLGISSGPEFNQISEEPDRRVRGDLLDEGLAIIRAAWTGEPVTHHGAHHRIDGVRFLPAPVQERIPIWGATERVRGRPVRRAATLDGVFPFGLRPEDAPALLEEIARHRPQGMDGYELIAAGDDDWQAWRDAGADWWLRVLPWRDDLATARAIVDAGPPVA